MSIDESLKAKHTSMGPLKTHATAATKMSLGEGIGMPGWLDAIWVS